MPNCKEHEDCDLVCSVCGDYYCLPNAHDSYHWPFYQRWRHVPRQETNDMPDDQEAYYNDRAERTWGIGAYDREAGRSKP